ncbi:protein SGT1-like isoform X2 [Dinothrombium tinctorium]|uniref:Protein SGT1-like isoform X2 n=1 Tax=Dinothrombium tinctorium TaxID=1965070 RepID=A0A443RQW3_9ACAR|nr:protein SGT1-like isoform X2 [Dinothrombium tinctorium]
MADKRLDENTVKYSLFINVKRTDEASIGEQLNNYINDAYGKLALYLTDYIWQNSPFCLKAVSDSIEGAHIEGYTTFDDNVDDEWFIVFLLVELSKRDPDLVVKIEDSDGEFLLIETADYLPKWLTPETSVNRVFIHKGELHVIPPSDESKKNEMPTIEEAVNIVVESKHKARCYIPAAVVALLEDDPSLISHAVRAFYTRDSIDLRACRAMKYFPPENRVMRNVTMTRCLYSQLISQKYNPDPKVGWNIPPPNSPDFKAYDLGMKIASGFEILVSSCNKPTEVPNNNVVFESNAWKQFISSLEKNGYFKDLLKGSKGHEELLKQAQTYFSNLVTQEKLEINYMNSRKYVGSKILKSLKTLDVDFDQLKREEESLEPEDSDEWMSIKPEELDEILKRTFRVSEKRELGDLAASIPKAMKRFVNYEKSGVEGAELPKKKNDINDLTEKVTFDSNAFGEALHSILNLQVPQSDTDSSSSGMSDYNSSDEDSLDSDDDEMQLLDQDSQRRNKEKEMETEEATINDMKRYMEAMDKELAKTNVGLSFEKKAKPPLAVVEDDSDDSDYTPVDVDLNALKNILESYQSQGGLPGPASNILSSMGVHLPQNDDSNSDKK